MPEEFTDKQKKIVAWSGFGSEFIVGIVMPWYYMLVAIVHLLAYTQYSKDGYSDFNFMFNKK